MARRCWSCIDSPRSGEVYNIGGGRDNSCSILEAFDRAAKAEDQAPGGREQAEDGECGEDHDREPNDQEAAEEQQRAGVGPREH